MNFKLFICGFMGSGKSRALDAMSRKNSSLEFIDLDQAVLRDWQKARPHLKTLEEGIEYYGWKAFREKELRLCKQLMGASQEMVVSLGGGALSQELLELIKNCPCSRLLFLNTTFETCLERIRNEEGRPLASKTDSELKTLYEERLPRYKSSDYILDESQGDRDLEDLFARILDEASNLGSQ